jgi:hypothetical protein
MNACKEIAFISRCYFRKQSSCFHDATISGNTFNHQTSAEISRQSKEVTGGCQQEMVREMKNFFRFRTDLYNRFAISGNVFRKVYTDRSNHV